jgi:hypothetical protein
VPSEPASAAPTHPISPLSPSQLRFWLAEQDGRPDPYRYITLAYRLAEIPDVRLVRRAVTAVVARHEALRSMVLNGSGGPVAVTSPTADIENTVRVRAYGDPAEPESDAAMQVDLVVGPGVDDCRVVFGFDHMWFDEWSERIISSDLETAFAAVRDGRESVWPAPVRQYREYVAWLAGQGDRIAEDIAYWRDHLDGMPPMPEPNGARGDGGAIAFRIDRFLVERLHMLAADRSITMFALLAAAYAEALRAEFAVDEVAVGTLHSGRDLAGFDETVGCFVNPICLRMPAGPDPIGSAHRELQAVRRHQLAPFEEVVAALHPARTGRHPLFQAWLMYYQRSYAPTTVFGLHATQERPDGTVDSADEIRLEVMETSNGLDGTLLYRRGWFTASRIESIRDAFTSVLDAWVATAVSVPATRS